VFVVEDEFAEVSVSSLDAALGELTGRAEVLPTDPACPALRVWAGATHGRHDEVTDAQRGDVFAKLDDFGDSLVAEDEVVAAQWWLAVLKRGDVAVCATDSDLVDPYQNLVAFGRWRLGDLDEVGRPSIGEDGERAHGPRPFS